MGKLTDSALKKVYKKHLSNDEKVLFCWYTATQIITNKRILKLSSTYYKGIKWELAFDDIKAFKVENRHEYIYLTFLLKNGEQIKYGNLGKMKYMEEYLNTFLTAVITEKLDGNKAHEKAMQLVTEVITEDAKKHKQFYMEHLQEKNNGWVGLDKDELEEELKNECELFYNDRINILLNTFKNKMLS